MTLGKIDGKLLEQVGKLLALKGLQLGMWNVQTTGSESSFPRDVPTTGSESSFPSIGSLQNLETLYLRHYELEYLPNKEIGNLLVNFIKLRELDISFALMDEFPGRVLQPFQSTRTQFH